MLKHLDKPLSFLCSLGTERAPNTQHFDGIAARDSDWDLASEWEKTLIWDSMFGLLKKWCDSEETRKQILGGIFDFLSSKGGLDTKSLNSFNIKSLNGQMSYLYDLQKH